MGVSDLLNSRIPVVVVVVVVAVVMCDRRNQTLISGADLGT